MFDHEGRSHAPPPPIARQRWRRPDAPRPEAPRQPQPLPSADPIVPQLDPPEPMTGLDHLALLSPAARQDLAATSLAKFGGGAL